MLDLESVNGSDLSNEVELIKKLLWPVMKVLFAIILALVTTIALCPQHAYIRFTVQNIV